jgi:hypothetical protein
MKVLVTSTWWDQQDRLQSDEREFEGTRQEIAEFVSDCLLSHDESGRWRIKVLQGE